MFKQIRDIEVGEVIIGYYLVKSQAVKTSSNGKKYIDYYFTDRTGVCNGKHWGPETDEHFNLVTGTIVKVEAEIAEFNQQKQFRIRRIRAINETDNITISKIVPSAPIEAEKMYEIIMSYVNNFKDEEIKAVVKTIMQEYKKPLMYYPAAKSNHHSIMAGLLYHELRMLQSAEAICNVYENIDRDLLYAGVILHDLEKINEMSADEYGVVSTYTPSGNLLGHIIMGVKNVADVSKRLGISTEKSMLLEHLILSHHYEPEFGSPVKPMILEGEILHHLDVIDARLYDFENALKNVEAGDFSEPIFSLDRRRIYKPAYTQQKSAEFKVPNEEQN